MLNNIDNKEGYEADFDIIDEAYLRGPQGDQGPKGDKGDKGDVGEKGDTGEKGFDGEKGDQGQRGFDGEKGKDGVDGIDGNKIEPKEIADKLNTLEGIIKKEVLDFNITDEVVKGIKTSSKKLLSHKDIDMSDMRWHGAGISTVTHDSTLSGLGTTSSPLSVVGGAGGVTQLLAGTSIILNPSGGTGIVTISSTGGGGSPGGSNTDIQFNNSGSFGGSNNATLDSSGNAKVFSLVVNPQTSPTYTVAAPTDNGSISVSNGSAQYFNVPSLYRVYAYKIDPTTAIKIFSVPLNIVLPFTGTFPFENIITITPTPGSTGTLVVAYNANTGINAPWWIDIGTGTTVTDTGPFFTTFINPPTGWTVGFPVVTPTSPFTPQNASIDSQGDIGGTNIVTTNKSSNKIIVGYGTPDDISGVYSLAGTYNSRNYYSNGTYKVWKYVNSPTSILWEIGTTLGSSTNTYLTQQDFETTPFQVITNNNAEVGLFYTYPEYGNILGDLNSTIQTGAVVANTFATFSDLFSVAANGDTRVGTLTNATFNYGFGADGSFFAANGGNFTVDFSGNTAIAGTLTVMGVPIANYWTDNGSNGLYNSIDQFVGINITTPVYALDVYDSGASGFDIGNSTTMNWRMGSDGTIYNRGIISYDNAKQLASYSGVDWNLFFDTAQTNDGNLSFGEATGSLAYINDDGSAMFGGNNLTIDTSGDVTTNGNLQFNDFFGTGYQSSIGGPWSAQDQTYQVAGALYVQAQGQVTPSIRLEQTVATGDTIINNIGFQFYGPDVGSGPQWNGSIVALDLDYPQQGNYMAGQIATISTGPGGIMFNARDFPYGTQGPISMVVGAYDAVPTLYMPPTAAQVFVNNTVDDGTLAAFQVTGDMSTNGNYWAQAMEGQSVTITTAQLTIAGSQGSMTFTGGILTGETQAT